MCFAQRKLSERGPRSARRIGAWQSLAPTRPTPPRDLPHYGSFLKMKTAVGPFSSAFSRRQDREKLSRRQAKNRKSKFSFAFFHSRTLVLFVKLEAEEWKTSARQSWSALDRETERVLLNGTGQRRSLLCFVWDNYAAGIAVTDFQ